ncbi:MAG TPA: aspartyl/asparaginyl beta-hydroxylase domain-containing protein [Rhizomicrobium sp.]|jgi:hypothetical protein|nr:aspartyl/asparaginyl beta-hydroxylase domain-containing protein [Rhizomicrobium sp.]
MQLPDRLRLPFSFDPAGLARDLAVAEAGGWRHHFVRQNYEGDWSVIALRASAAATHPSQMINADPRATTFRDLPVLADCAHFRAAIAAVQAPLRAVRLMRLTPGSVIKEHTDPDLGFEDGAVRIHVPIVTNRHVDFRLNGARVTMEAGSAWYLRLSDPHTVRNDGDTDRVHLVIDAVVNEWMTEMFATSQQEAA